MSTLSNITAISSFGSVIAPTPVRAVGKVRVDAGVDRQTIEQQARVLRAEIVGAMIGSGIASLWGQVRRTLRKRAAVAELSALDDRMLADIGLSRSQIRAAVDSATGFIPEMAMGPGPKASFNDNIGRHAA